MNTNVSGIKSNSRVRRWAIILVCLQVSYLTGCSLEVSLTDLISPEQTVIDKLERKSPDFVSSEVVTTSSGYKIRAVIGEVAERKVLANGYKFEGAFNE